MPSLKELREKAKSTVDEMKKLRDEYNQRKDAGKTGSDLWPDATEKRWSELNAEYATLETQIAEETRSEDLDRHISEMEKRHAKPDASGDRRNTKPGRDDFDAEQFRSREDFVEQRDMAIAAWAGRDSKECRSERHLAAAQRFGINPASDKLVIDLLDTNQFRAVQHQFRNSHRSLLEQRALSAHEGTSGGFMIGSTLVSAMEINMLAYGGVEQVADVLSTETGEEINWPTADDTSNEGSMIGENPSSPSETEPTFANVRWAAYEFSSDLVKVPVRLLEDAPGDFASQLGAMLGERLGRATNRKFTSGTGASQPKGVVTAATLGKTAASATAIISNELIQLQHALDPAYRNGASWMMHDNIVLAIRLLKDSNGQYMWQPGLQEGTPDRLLTRPVTINQHMDSAVAASNKTVLFGQFTKYKVRRVRQVVILRLNERFAETRQVGFIGFVRADGNLLDAGTAPIVYLQQASS